MIHAVGRHRPETLSSRNVGQCVGRKRIRLAGNGHRIDMLNNTFEGGDHAPSVLRIDHAPNEMTLTPGVIVELSKRPSNYLRAGDIVTSVQPQLSAVADIFMKRTSRKELKTRWPFDFQQTASNGINPNVAKHYVGNCYGHSSVVELMAAFESRRG